jgi:hypothetical protein
MRGGPNTHEQVLFFCQWSRFSRTHVILATSGRKSTGRSPKNPCTQCAKLAMSCRQNHDDISPDAAISVDRLTMGLNRMLHRLERSFHMLGAPVICLRVTML